MEKEIVKKYIEEIEKLAEDINVAEINSQCAFGNMKEWVNAWQGAMNQCIDNIKEAIKNE